MKHKNNEYLQFNIEPTDLGIYIHIPFCVKKCDYCDFLSAPADEETKKYYIEALLTQIESYRGRTEGYQVPTIFIGGGTPSCLKAEAITAIMEKIRDVFLLDEEQLEATIEVNPGILTKEKLIRYKKAGLNRLSFGLQSADDTELKLLGRIHSYEQFLNNYTSARETGFKNINVDLMSALPGQTPDSWEKTLTRVIGLNPEHISAYSLIIEEGTPFEKRFGKGMPEENLLPGEDEDRLIYHMTKDILQANGYHRYEISNYAREGFESRHNSSYWTGTQYLGLGLGASSLLQSRAGNGTDLRPQYLRFRTESNLSEYLRLCGEYSKSNKTDNQNNVQSIVEEFNIDKISNLTPSRDIVSDPIGLSRDIQRLSNKDRMEEYMFLGLRLCRGVSREEFAKRFGRQLDTVYGDVIHKLIGEKLLEASGDSLRLTDYGIDVSNVVLSEFLLEK